jgi:hypothetical protein
MMHRQLQFLAIAAATLTPIAIVQPVFPQESPLVGTWRQVGNSSAGGGYVMIVSFESNGTIKNESMVASNGQPGSGSSITQWYGTYKITGSNSFVTIIRGGRESIGGIWYNCPHQSSNPQFDACETVERMSGRKLGIQKSIRFKIDGSNQLLIENVGKFKRIR